MLRSVQRLERHGGFRPRLFESRRDYLEYVEIVKIQGAERDTWPRGSDPPEDPEPNGRQTGCTADTTAR